MSTRKKHDGSCVSRQECAEAMEPLKSTMETVKNALVGKDLRSGLVQQVNNLDNKVQNLITQSDEEKRQAEKKRKEILRWKMAAVGFAATVFGIVLQFLFSHFTH